MQQATLMSRELARIGPTCRRRGEHDKRRHLTCNNTEHWKIRLRHHCRFKAGAGISKPPSRDNTWTRPLREQIAAFHIGTQNTASYPGVNFVSSLDLDRNKPEVSTRITGRRGFRLGWAPQWQWAILTPTLKAALV